MTSLGTIMPDELIPIAEENGLIHDIGAFVLEEAAKLAAQWNKEGQTYGISVNSSVREFSNTQMKDKIINILEDNTMSRQTTSNLKSQRNSLFKRKRKIQSSFR